MEAIKLCRLDTPIIFIEARINLSRFVVTGCAAKTSATVTRSEERRVGKECKYHVDAVDLEVYKKSAEEAGVTDVRLRLEKQKLALWREINVGNMIKIRTRTSNALRC